MNSTFTYLQNETSGRHATSPERFLTTENERDFETGYDYRGARYYDSEVGRFWGVDVLADSFPAWSPYNYVMANPVSFVDPDGRFPRLYEDRGSEGGGEVIITEADKTRVGLTLGDWLAPIPVVGSTYYSGQYLEQGDYLMFTLEFSYAVLEAFTFTLGHSYTLTRRAAMQLSRSAALEGRILANASKTAFKAADNVSSIYIKNKHLSSATGNYAKFATTEISTAQGWVQQALRSPNARFLPNPQIPNTFQVVTDVGTTIGTKGQTSIRAIVGFDGKVINAFPVR